MHRMQIGKSSLNCLLTLSLSLTFLPLAEGSESGQAAGAEASSDKHAPAGTAAGDIANSGSGENQKVGVKQGDGIDKPAELSLPPKWQPGMELEIGTNAQDLVPTDDVEMARKQVLAFPDSAEASFILAVALTRTSKVEEALKEVRRARKLAEQKGGNAYFDKMIASYEDMLKNFPNENRVRYGLAWAYYMKAYLLANYSRKVAAWKAKNGDPMEVLAKANFDPSKVAALSKVNDTGAGDKEKAADTKTQAQKAESIKVIKESVKSGNSLDVNGIINAVGALAQGNTAALPKIPSVMDNVDPQDIQQIRKYYEAALTKLDELLVQKPDDVWSLVYRAHLKAEYTGNLDEAMQTWTQCREKFPNNPASYFFLGEGYLKQGNLKESLNNVSRAVALRALGN